MEANPINGRTFWVALILALLGLGIWEYHWRSEGYVRALEDDKDLWAINRAKVDQLGADGIVLVGSSRSCYGWQLDEWEEVTGRRPVQLSALGVQPYPVFEDIVDHSEFNGTIVFGVSTPLFFGPLSMDDFSYARIKIWVDYFHKRSYAKRLNHQVAKLFQYNLSFLNATEEPLDNELDLETLVNQLPVKDRIPGLPYFPLTAYVDEDRNFYMVEQMSDTVYAQKIIDVYAAFFGGIDMDNPPPAEIFEADRDALLAELLPKIEKFKARGGEVIFVRHPSQSFFNAAELLIWPRANFWDELIKQSGCPGYHYQDYTFMQGYTLPDISHLITPDAKTYTRDQATQLLADGHLKTE